MNKQILSHEEAENIVQSSLPNLLGNAIYSVCFPEERKDVCAVLAREVYSPIGPAYWTIYLVWKESDGIVKMNRIGNNQRVCGIMFIEEISANGDQITVAFGNNCDGKITAKETFISAWKDFSKWWR